MNQDNKITIELNPFLQSTSQSTSGTTKSRWIYLRFIEYTYIVLKVKVTSPAEIIVKYIKKILDFNKFW